MSTTNSITKPHNFITNINLFKQNKFEGGISSSLEGNKEYDKRGKYMLMLILMFLFPVNVDYLL